jgi:hypothetical protein
MKMRIVAWRFNKTRGQNELIFVPIIGGLDPFGLSRCYLKSMLCDSMN